MRGESLIPPNFFPTRQSVGNSRNQEQRRGVSTLVKNAIDFELPNQEDKAWRLADHLARGPVLLVFYRGDW